MLKLDYDAVHRFAAKYPGASWDGWDLLLWKENSSAARHPSGVLRDGKWGMQTRVSPNDEGRWVIRV